MKTKVQICNSALRILSIYEDIESIDNPITRWERICNAVWDNTLDLALTQHMPSFAITPDPVVINPAPNMGFIIPSDCLRVLEVNGQKQGFHEIGGQVQLDYPHRDPNLIIRYVRRITETGYYSPEFLLVLEAELAVTIAPSTKDKKIIEIAERNLAAARASFGGINAQKLKLNTRYKIMFNVQT